MPWARVADLADFAGRDVIGVEHGERKLAIYRLEDGVYATTDVCPHAAARLSAGEVVEGYIECPGHFALFDIRTGESGGGLATGNLTTYPARLDGTRICVLLDEA